MTRIPGVGRSSASPPLETKEEYERNVEYLRPEDPIRWEKRMIRETGTCFVPEGSAGAVLGLVLGWGGKCILVSPPLEAP